MKKLVLHVGNPKTGTTAIQQYCFRNESKLKADGVCYSSIGRDFYQVNHKAFHFSFLKEMQLKFRADPGALIKDLNYYIDGLYKEIVESDLDLFLISFEGLSGLSMYPEAARLLEKMRNSLSEVCEIVVLLYVRGPWSNLLSNYNERCKRKNFTGLFLDFVNDSHDVVLDQFFSYRFFVSSFGKESVKPVLFGEEKGVDFIQNFFSRIGADHVVGDSIDPLDKPVNESLPLEHIEFSRIRAVLELELDTKKEDILLHGKKNVDLDYLSGLEARLERINENNKRGFRELFSVDVNPITLCGVLLHERKVNSEFMRRLVIDGQLF